MALYCVTLTGVTVSEDVCNCRLVRNYSFLLEIEDAVALENAKIPWTSQKFCVSNVILTATGAGVVVVLILVLVAVVLVTWRCTKCLGKSSRDDQDSTRTPSELRAELGNGK